EKLLRLRGNAAVRNDVAGELFSGPGIDNGCGDRGKVRVRSVQSSLRQGNRGVDLFSWTTGLLGALIACKEEEPVLKNRAADPPSELLPWEARDAIGEEGRGIHGGVWGEFNAR